MAQKRARKGRSKKGASKKNKSRRSLMLFFMFGILALYLSTLLNENAQEKKALYSEIKTAISRNQIKKVQIGNETLKAFPHDTSSKVLVTRMVNDETLVPLLEEKNVQFEGKEDRSWLSEFLFSWIIPIVFLIFLWQFIIGRSLRQGGPPGLLSFGKSRAKLVENQGKDRVTFKDVAGVDEVKEELNEIIAFLKTPEKFKAIGGRIPKGVLLVGPPGTGKTLLARAVAGEASVNFFQISGSDFVEMFVGVGAARVRDLFQEAQKKAPCIIFIDELDAVAKSRGGSAFSNNDERENTLNQILVEMDGFDNHSGVIIIAATNRPEVLDPAILRPGRFDRQVIVDAPDLKGRVEILKVHAAKIKLEKNVNLEDLAGRTPMFTGADLANLCNEAALLAVRQGLKKVNQDCLEEAVDRVMAGLARKSRVLPEDEKKTVATHETGHAVVAHFTENADKVHRISIIPRSKGALGFIQQVPEEERHLMTQEDLLGRIRVLLGGRAAEKVLIGKVTTGAYDDLKRASDMARRMITEFGMGDSLGLVSLSERNEQYQNNPFIQSGTADVSNETAQKIDVEIRKILDREFQNACQIIQEKTSVIHKMITRLLEKETIEGKEITELFGAGARKGAQGTKTKDDPNSSAIISGIDNERSF